MNRLIFGLAAAAAALAAGEARAADSFGMQEYYAPPPVVAVPSAPLVQNHRTICDQFGRCWRERVATIAESYDDGPRPPALVYQQPVYRAAPPARRYYEAPPPHYGAPPPRIYAPAPDFVDEERW